MLVILHAGVGDGQCLLWGETPAEKEAVDAWVRSGGEIGQRYDTAWEHLPTISSRCP